MQAGADFLFHLDFPKERPEVSAEDLGGWIAALHPVTELKLTGAAETPLHLLDRPDVSAAFPGYPHVTGFAGRTTPADFKDRAARVTFTVGGEPREVELALPPAPPVPPAWRRWLARSEAALARRRLRGQPPASVRWREGLRLILAELRARRGDRLDRATADLVIQHFAATFPDACVVQIGANDGLSGDPLAAGFASTRWRGLLVEPIPHLAAALAARYAGRPGIVVERAAISQSDGEATIHRIAPDSRAPAWHQQLASLDRAVLLKHRELVPDLESRIVEEPVPTLTVATLLRRHQVAAIDLLAIDTEGLDWEILRQFDLARLQPRLILFEHQHLKPADAASARAFLRRHGYGCATMPEGDALAWKFS